MAEVIVSLKKQKKKNSQKTIPCEIESSDSRRTNKAMSTLNF
jgi:hypothetical protein